MKKLEGISVISDVHVKDETDDAYHILLKFLDHQKVKNSQKVFFLGDIFDLMSGAHKEYYKKYPDFFQKIKSLVASGVEINYFEGNHDMHIKKLFLNFLSDTDHHKENFKVHRKYYVENIWGKSFYFCHGDEMHKNLTLHKIYKFIIQSFPFQFLSNYVVSYDLLQYFGKKASKASRKRSQIEQEKIDAYRDLFRVSAMRLARKGYDYIVAGHSHILDNYLHSDEDLTFRYLNTGIPVIDRKFLHINQAQEDFEDL